MFTILMGRGGGDFFIRSQAIRCWIYKSTPPFPFINPVMPIVLLHFTLANVRHFYLSMGKHLGITGLTNYVVDPVVKAPGHCRVNPFSTDEPF